MKFEVNRKGDTNIVILWSDDIVFSFFLLRELVQETKAHIKPQENEKIFGSTALVSGDDFKPSVVSLAGAQYTSRSNHKYTIE